MPCERSNGRSRSMEGMVAACLLLILQVVAVARGVTAISYGGTGVAIETQSNKANEFFTGFFASDEKAEEESVFLFITTDEPVPVQFTVNTTDPPFSETRIVHRGTIASIELPRAAKVSSNSERNKAVHIKAEGERTITVHGAHYASNSIDVFTALPCLENPVPSIPNYERQHYHIFSAKPNTSDASSSILIVGCRDNTEIQLVSSGPTVIIPSDVNPDHSPAVGGSPVNFRLDTAQTILLESSGDLSNSILRSTQPIAVLTGHRCAQVPIGADGCGHLVQQVPPHFTWGKAFFVAALQGQRSADIVWIANSDFGNATVNITCVQKNNNSLVRNTTFLKRRDSLSFALQPEEFCCIESTQPLLVMMHSQGYSTDTLDKIGGPLLLTVPPLDQYSNNFLINTQIMPQSAFDNYVNIIVPNEFFDNSTLSRSNVRLNDSEAAMNEDWHPISCYNGETCAWVARLSLLAGTSSVFHRNPQAGMAVFVYGIGSQSSYGYTAGYSLDPITLPIITLSTSELIVPENVSVATVVILRHGDTSVNTSVNVTVAGREASDGDDFVLVDQMVEFRPGDTMKSINLTIVNDMDQEANESLVLTVSSSDPSVVLSQRETTIIITDDDKFTVGFEFGSYTIREDDGFLNLAFVSNVEGEMPFQFRFYTLDGTAMGGIDFVSENRTVIFDSGIRRAEDRVEILDDEVVEGVEETFILRLEAVNAEDAPFIGLDRATVTIIDINMVQIFLSPTFVEASENSGNVTITVEKRDTTQLITNIVLLTNSSSAIAGEDYIALTSLSLQFLPEVSFINVTLSLIDNDALEGDEVIILEAVAAEGEERVVLQQPTATIEILDEDSIAVLFDRDLYTVSEGSGNITVNILKQGANSIPVTISVRSQALDATIPADFIGIQQGTIVLQPSNMNASYPVSVLLRDDSVVENPERFLLIISSSRGRGVDVTEPFTTNVIILDDDAVEIGFSQVNYTVVEGAASVQLKVQKTGESSVDVSVLVSTLVGTTQGSEDYVEVVNQRLSFAPSATEQTVTISLVDNNITEETETFFAQLRPFDSKVVLASGRSTARIEIIDNDVAELNFVLSSYTYQEADGQVELTIEKMGVSTKPISINISFEDVTAIADQDFIPITQQNIFMFGEDDPTLLVKFSITDDDIAESMEEFRVRVELTRGDTGARIGSNNTATVSIVDNDIVEVRFDPVSLLPVPEGFAIGFRVVKETTTEVNVTVQFSTVDLEAQAPADYIRTVTNLTFAPSGFEMMLVLVQTVDDDIWESVERFRGVLTAVSPSVNVTDGDALAAIGSDAGDAVVVRFFQRDVTVSELDRVVVMSLVKQGGNEAPVSIRVSSVAGTARADSDYVDVLQDVVFSASDVIQHINVSVMVDQVLEDTEFFTLQLTPILGTTVDTFNASLTVNILDSTTGVEIGFSPVEFDVSEQASAAIFRVKLFGVTERALTVTFNTTGGTATVGEDYVRTTTEVTLLAGETEQEVRVPLINDTIVEVQETITAELTNLDQGVVLSADNGSATAIINNDDRVVIEFASPEYTVGEGDGEVMLVVVKRGVALRNVSVSFSTIDETASGNIIMTDYAPITQTLTFEPHVTFISVNISILDNAILEEPEVFIGILGIIHGEDGVAPGQETTRVTIVDDDAIDVEFTRAEFRGFEGEELVSLTVTKRGDNQFTVILHVTTEDGTATAADDYISTNTTIEFGRRDGPTKVVSLTVRDDLMAEEEEYFIVRLSVSSSAVSDRVRLLRNNATVRIIDNDGPLPPVVCKVEDSILITPFHELSPGIRNYNFHAACEHILVSTCDVDPVDFVITVDFIASDLAMGRVGVRLGNKTVVINEDLSVTVTNLGDPLTMDGVTTVYTGNVTITEDLTLVVIALDVLGVQLTRVQDALYVNVSREGTPFDACGLCGTLTGSLLYSDRSTTADNANRLEVENFADSWRSNPSEQFLREQTRDCGFLSNDVIIGDPLFTVPLYNKDGITPANGVSSPSLCFEIHGAANQVFNLVSDRCTSVNAFYSPMNIRDNGNIISAVGVNAVDSQGQCVEITVRLQNGCMPEISSNEGTVSTTRYASRGVSVRKRGRVVRISVPNCENNQLSMLVSCDNFGGQEMIKYVITRGVNLRPTSHGLLGQFWNIPVTFEPYNYTGSNQHILNTFIRENLYTVTVQPVDGPQRTFVAELYHRTWDRPRSPCYYAGSSQGGPLNEFESPSDPIIQGQYRQYRLRALHDTDFVYSQFDSDLCN